MVVEGPQGYPNAPGSYAYIVSREIFRSEEHQDITITGTNTIGYLAVGQLGWVRHGFFTNGIRENIKTDLPWLFLANNSAGGGALRFETEDGSPSWIRLLGHSYVTSSVWFQLPIVMANDLEVDELYRVQDTLGWQNTRTRGLRFLKPVDIGTNEFRTIRGRPYHYRFMSSPFKHAGGFSASGWISFRNDILGAGRIRLEAPTHVGLQGAENAHTASFSGIWDVANGDLDPHLNKAYGAAGLNLWGLSLGNAKELFIRGSWHRAEKTWPRGALARTGFWNVDGYNDTDRYAWTNDWQNGLPGRITLDGGDLQIHPQGQMIGTVKTIADSSGIRLNVFRIKDFFISEGPMSRLEAKIKDDASWPNVRTEITNLILESTSVSSFVLDSSTTGASSEFFIVNRPAAAWDSPNGTGLQFLPFFFANNQMEAKDGVTQENPSVDTPNNTRLAFRDPESGKVSLGTPDETPNSFGNYRRWTAGEELADGAEYYSMQLAQNVTNSFKTANVVVQNLAGYLDMRGGAALGRPGLDAGATLDFGDQPARIFNGIWGETGTVGCKLAGTAGLVTGGNGTIALGASAEGVAGGVRVAGGTLELLNKTVPFANGTIVARGRIAGDIRVEAGSRLVVYGAACIAPGSQLFLNDRDWIPSYGHVQLLDPGRPVYVRELVIGGERMPHGYYGSSKSGAEHADDVHFEGPGTIYAGTLPTLMIFK
jgi:hypothetical protein